MTHDWFSCKPQFISLYETSEIFYGLRETFTDFHRLQRLVETFFEPEAAVASSTPYPVATLDAFPSLAPGPTQKMSEKIPKKSQKS